MTDVDASPVCTGSLMATAEGLRIQTLICQKCYDGAHWPLYMSAQPRQRPAPKSTDQSDAEVHKQSMQHRLQRPAWQTTSNSFGHTCTHTHTKSQHEVYERQLAQTRLLAKEKGPLAIAKLVVLTCQASATLEDASQRGTNLPKPTKTSPCQCGPTKQEPLRASVQHLKASLGFFAKTRD